MGAYYRKCPECQANLDPGERCDCQRQTAGCPYFMTRVDWKGISSIVCSYGDQVRIQEDKNSREDRDQHYRALCCGDYCECRSYRFIEQFRAQKGERT